MTLGADTIAAESPTSDAPAPPKSVSDPTLRQHWRRYRLTAAVVLFLIAVAVVVSVAGSPSNQGDLDPRSYESSGTHALATLLADRGVHVDTETTAASAQAHARAGSTLVVVNPDRLGEADLATIADTAADLLVVGAAPLDVGGLDLGVEPGGQGFGTQTVAPECELPAASTAGTIRIGTSGGAYAYRIPSGGQGCYPIVDGAALVSFENGGRRVTLLGDAAMLTNDQLAKEGNAALALGLLDANPEVVWLAPEQLGATDGTAHATVTSLLPGRLKWAVLQLAIAVGVVALWRGRRLGRLVPEALPVVVRQAETVVGRGRLYRRSRSLHRAAEALRTGSRDRLARRLGFGPAVGADALSDAISRRVGKPAHEIADVLYGPTPSDDRELVALAQRLSKLEQEVRTS